jgi:CubicO group peptidase (beta-lactamase class C family)
MRPLKSFIASIVLASILAAVLASTAAAASGNCATPGKDWERRDPGRLGLDAGRLQDALDWAGARRTGTVAVYRHGCLAAEGRVDPLTSQLPLDGWSMTKSVTSMLVGRAVTLGLFDIDRPIGSLYPEADAGHARLTPRHLLTMTSGTHVNWVRDLSPQPDRVADALSLPFDHEPGTFWAYEQSTVTLLANAVERSVGEDLQDFAQEQLFGPLGIPKGDWIWERDRANHTEGWAHLHMASRSWARLGQLMLQAGQWNGQQLISRTYLRKALSPLNVNNAYGFLFWRNGGGSYVLPDVEGPDHGTGQIIQSAPRDVFLMAGNGEQRVYVIPSRDMVVVRLGENGSTEGDTRVSVFTGRGGELDYELMRRVMLAVTDVRYGDPGPYPGSGVVLPPLDDGLVGDAQETDHVLAGLGLGPDAP